MGFDILKVSDNDPFFPAGADGMMVIDVFHRHDLVNPNSRKMTEELVDWLAVNAPNTQYAIRTSWYDRTMTAVPASLVLLFETNEEALHFKLRWQDQTS